MTLVSISGTTLRRIGVFALLMGLVAASFAIAPSVASAATYDPTYVITDDNMRDFNSMTSAEIQTFLSAKTGPLKTLRTADYAGTQRTAADIIWRAAQAWHINPKVLLVTLQKEQSLITVSNADNTARLRKAMGCGVYDVDKDGDIDNLYPGFGNQVWNAARLYDKYGESYDSSSTRKAWATAGYRIYDYNLKKYVQVYPKNVATLKLYVYTPYSSGPKSTQTLYQQYFGSAFSSPRYRPVYRFKVLKNGSYLYTSSVAEWSKLTQAAYKRSYYYSGVAFSADTSVPASAALPVYKFKSRVTGKWSYTHSREVYDARRSAEGAKKWQYCGIAFRASRYNTPGAVAVHRFVKRSTGGMFLTSSANTVKQWTTDPAYKKAWEYKGIVYYAPRYVEPAPQP